MKKLLVKIKITLLILASFLGFNLNNANATISLTQRNNNSNEIMDKVNKNTPLLLYHSSQVTQIKNQLMTWHYSHSSHYSHYSHVSHYSHYSSRY